MDAELLSLVCGPSVETLVREPAVVSDYQPFWVEDDHYPVLVPMQGAITHGLVLRDLSSEAIERIVFFEGGEFKVESIQVTLEDGTSETVSFFADNHLKKISDTIWNLDEWQRTIKPDTLPRVIRYMQCFGKMDVHAADAYW